MESAPGHWRQPNPFLLVILYIWYESSAAHCDNTFAREFFSCPWNIPLFVFTTHIGMFCCCEIWVWVCLSTFSVQNSFELLPQYHPNLIFHSKTWPHWNLVFSWVEWSRLMLLGFKIALALCKDWMLRPRWTDVETFVLRQLKATASSHKWIAFDHYR